MKREMMPIGWKEIETKIINIQKPFLTNVFSTAGEWVKFTTKKPAFDINGRNHCQCCRVKWLDLDSSAATYLIFTDKGNRVVCQICYDSFSPELLK